MRPYAAFTDLWGFYRDHVENVHEIEKK